MPGSGCEAGPVSSGDPAYLLKNENDLVLLAPGLGSGIAREGVVRDKKSAAALSASDTT